MPISRAPAAPTASASQAALGAASTTARKASAKSATSTAGKTPIPSASLPAATQPAAAIKRGQPVKIKKPLQSLKSVKAAAPDKAAANTQKKGAPQTPHATANKTETKAQQKAAKKPAKQRSKLVRDSFTMPQVDFELIAALKFRGLTLGRNIKKSELLRAGLQALAAFDDLTLTATLDKLEAVKIGRPKRVGSAA